MTDRTYIGNAAHPHVCGWAGHAGFFGSTINVVIAHNSFFICYSSVIIVVVIVIPYETGDRSQGAGQGEKMCERGEIE